MIKYIERSVLFIPYQNYSVYIVSMKCIYKKQVFNIVYNFTLIIL